MKYFDRFFALIFTAPGSPFGPPSGPFWTIFNKNCRFKSFTLTGFVKFLAIFNGTPNYR